jgi:hypothetical protein
MPTPSDPSKPEDTKTLLEALGAITSSGAPQALKLMQILDITKTSIDPQTDSLMKLINTKALTDLKDLTNPDTSSDPTATSTDTSSVDQSNSFLGN